MQRAIGVLDHTLGRTPLDGGCARRHKCQTSMSPEEFEPAIPTIKRPQVHTLDWAAPGLSLFSFIWSLSPIISLLSHGFPLFVSPTKMKLNTPLNIRVNDSQHCRMPCRISVVAWTGHPPHISLCELGHLHTKRLVCRLLSGSRKVFRIICSVILICTQFWVLRSSRTYWTRLYTAVPSFPRSKYLLATQKWTTSNMEARSRTASRKLYLPRVCPVCAGNLVTFPSYKPLTFLFKPPTY